MKVRVLLVDDHPLYLLGIRAALEEAGCIDVVSECPTAEAVAMARELRPDVVLMELPTPPGEGLGVIREMTGLVPAPNVVVTSVLDDDCIVRALRAGVRGYLVRDAEPVEVRHAVSVAAPGGAVFSPAVAARLGRLFAGLAGLPGREPLPILSPREREILGLMCRGLDNRRIARHLVVTEKTVRNHVSNLVAKLQVGDRVGAVVRARNAGLVD